MKSVNSVSASIFACNNAAISMAGQRFSGGELLLSMLGTRGGAPLCRKRVPAGIADSDDVLLGGYVDPTVPASIKDRFIIFDISRVLGF